MAKSKKVLRQEARKTFIKEIVKNMSQEDQGESHNKLLQNYTALNLVYLVLMAPEKKNNAVADGRIKAIQ